MRVRAVLLAAALVAGPARRQGRRPRGLVGEGLPPRGGPGGPGDRRRLRAKTGKKVELDLPSQDDMPAKIVAAVEAGQPPDFVFGTTASAGSPGGPTRTGSSTSRTSLGPLRASSTRTGSTAAPCSTRPPAGAASTPCRWGVLQPRPRLAQPARAGRVRARRHPQGVGAVLDVLVRQGPAGGPQGHGAARTLGRRPGDVGRGDRHRRQFRQFVARLRGRLRRPATAGSVIDEPAVRAGSSRRSTPTRRSGARAAPRPTRSAGTTAATTRRSWPRRS